MKTLNTTALLHRDVYFPENLNLIQQTKKLEENLLGFQLSQHLMDRIKNNNNKHCYTEKDIENALNLVKKQCPEPFEVELSRIRGKFYITKYVCRCEYNNKAFCVVIRPKFNINNLTYNKYENLIVTVYLNDVFDSHKTLEVNRYVTKEEWSDLERKYEY